MAAAQKTTMGVEDLQVGEELDEASVWEAEFWKEREKQHEDGRATADGAAARDGQGHDQRGQAQQAGGPSSEGKENQRDRLAGGKRQSFVLHEGDSEKEDSGKSTHTGNGLLKVQVQSKLLSPSTAYIPIKQSRTGGGEGFGVAQGIYSQSMVTHDLTGFDHGLSAGMMGTSAPINIPETMKNQFYKKRGSHASNEVDSPISCTRAHDFVPPHLIATENENEEDPELSTSFMKREQLKHRNTILKQTGFVEENNKKQ